jgi:hypothetical protein
MMKILKLLTAGFVVLFASMTANASTVLSATDGDVNFLFGSISSYQLYMFDDTGFGTSTNLLIDIPSIVGISGPQSGDYLAANNHGSLTLTGAPNFVLGISTDGVNFIADNGATTYGNGNAATVYFNIPGANGGSVLAVDVVPAVPVPAAAWLFGSGLLGLVGVARRRRA